MSYEWNFSAVTSALPILLGGLVVSLQLAIAALAVAAPLGLLLAIVRISRNKLLAGVGTVYVEVFRTAAALILIFWFFYAFPILIGVNITAFWAAVLAIGLQSAAYFSEAFRSGIATVHAGQWDAAASVGLTRRGTLRYVVMPQAIRAIIPVIFLRIVECFKATSLASVIALPEITYQASVISTTTYRPMETYTTLATIYFILLFSLSRIAALMEKR